MSVSCVGTCSHCGTRRFWISDTLSLQLDDGRLKCLPHPAESFACEDEGLTLAQASDRGRLFRETFYVCRSCGQAGQTIDRATVPSFQTFPPRVVMKWAWGAAVIIVPPLLWLRWWQAAATIGATLLAAPAIYWRENRKAAKALIARGLPRPDAPGSLPIPPPTAGCVPDVVVGRRLHAGNGRRATGPCCDKPDWIEAFGVKDEDHVPCSTCQTGVMRVSDHAIH